MNKMTAKTLMVSALAGLLCPALVAWAQGDVATAAAQPDSTGAHQPATNMVAVSAGTVEAATLREPDAGPDAAVRTAATGEQLISISLDDVPLEDVVRMFTRISGANIIASGTNLEGNVTVNLTDVEWKPALSSILDMHGLTLTEKTPGSGVYSVVPKQTDVPEPMIVETLFLNYTTVNDVSPVIKAMLVTGPPAGTFSPFNSRNAVVLRSTSANLSEIKQVLKLIDIPGQQVCIETKFMELSDKASKQLGIKWDSLESFGAKLGLGPFEYSRQTETKDSNTDTYKRWQTDETSDELNNLYNVDGVQYEEVKDIKIVENADATESYTLKSITPTRTVSDTISSGEDNKTETVNSFNKTITESQSAILELDSFSVILSALKKTDGVSIISNPKLIVASGEESAFFSVGDREPIIKTDITRGTQDSPGDKVTAQLDTTINTEYIKEGYLETGIELRVVPIIKSDRLIEAVISPTLRRRTGEKTVGDNSWPTISVKDIKTRFTLRDKQTVAIGGLTDSTDSKATTKIPFLGDIPLIGKYLFSHTKDVKNQVETIIFVTLSLAQPGDLRDDEGIPEQAELVHKKLIQNALRQRKFEHDISVLKQAAQDEMAGAHPSDQVEPKPLPPVGSPAAATTKPPQDNAQGDVGAK